MRTRVYSPGVQPSPGPTNTVNGSCYCLRLMDCNEARERQRRSRARIAPLSPNTPIILCVVLRACVGCAACDRYVRHINFSHGSRMVRSLSLSCGKLDRSVHRPGLPERTDSAWRPYGPTLAAHEAHAQRRQSAIDRMAGVCCVRSCGDVRMVRHSAT